MANSRTGSDRDEPRRLPRGRHALAPEEVAADQRQRLIEAVPGVVSERGYEAMSVADIVRAAGVSRNAFYDNFGDKRACFAAAQAACHERLLTVLEARCERGMSVEERVEAALGAALAMLAAEPSVCRLLFVEAPAAGRDIALCFYDWLRRYGTLLRSALPQAAERSSLAVEIDQVIVGGIATRIASEVLHGRTRELRLQIPSLAAYVLAFYGPDRALSETETPASPQPDSSVEQAEQQRRSA